ncbi:MAG: aminotransferase class I/II-fold pyridoxal phosphate-dependent enzyme [Thermodesulfobacteriota bacterium]|nr:aminotransferase class I/II-fold pyridoxal phosphate-dependent enzyme [Thermodesulfobacteriota bacterium]
MIAGHGGNVRALAAAIGCRTDEITDMSSNLNPLGPPDGLTEHLKTRMGDIACLPEADAGEMVTAFAECHNMPPDRILAGNGTTSFIYTFPAALKSEKVLIAGPTYSDYRDGCIMNSTDYEFYLTDPDSNFEMDTAEISKRLSTPGNKINTVVLCNPNNPTGALVEKTDILTLLETHKKTFFIIDESYLPFVDRQKEITLADETKFANLIVLSSMSKIFTIPGLRTGFITASPNIIKQFTAFYQPWSVNALAQAAVVYLLKNRGETQNFIQNSREVIHKEKQTFTKSLGHVSKIRLFQSSACFILAQLRNELTAGDVCEEVGKEKILIRNCENFHGLSDRFIRFSLKDRTTNLKLARLLQKIEAR